MFIGLPKALMTACQPFSDDHPLPYSDTHTQKNSALKKFRGEKNNERRKKDSLGYEIATDPSLE